MANPFALAVNSVGSLAPGHIVLASEWNTAVGGLYTYINSTLLGGLNKMASQGDVYVFDGTNLQVVSTGGSGNDGKFLTARSTAPSNLGVDWEAAVNTTTLTTKGDLLAYSSNLTRLPVGTDGQVLTARSTATDGIDWETAPGVPLGGIILWDTSQRAIPSGYNLCDGGTYNGYLTPNMQGLYLVGAGTSANPAATNGMGVVASGTIAGDTSAGTGLGPKHAHAVFGSPQSLASGGASLWCGASSSLNTTGSATVTPRYGALAFIMRTQ